MILGMNNQNGEAHTGLEQMDTGREVWRCDLAKFCRYYRGKLVGRGGIEPPTP